jgi:hypothetical protein
MQATAATNKHTTLALRTTRSAARGVHPATLRARRLPPHWCAPGLAAHRTSAHGTGPRHPVVHHSTGTACCRHTPCTAMNRAGAPLWSGGRSRCGQRLSP